MTTRIRAGGLDAYCQQNKLSNPLGRAKRRNKYNAKPVTVEGQWCASTKEGARYAQLLVLQKAGVIINLRCQVNYPLSVNGVHICDYRADFVYIEQGREIVEDAKGVRTSDYKLKAKLMLAVYGITILET